MELCRGLARMCVAPLSLLSRGGFTYLADFFHLLSPFHWAQTATRMRLASSDFGVSPARFVFAVNHCPCTQAGLGLAEREGEIAYAIQHQDRTAIGELGDGMRRTREGKEKSCYSMLFSTKARTMASTWVLASAGIMSFASAVIVMSAMRA